MQDLHQALLIQGNEEPIVPAVTARRPELHKFLLEHGAVLLRNFDVGGKDAFHEVVRILAGEPLPTPKTSHLHSVRDGEIRTSADYPADREISLRNENSYQARWPMKMFFHCVRPATARGATVLADTRRVNELINPALRAEFAACGWRIRRNFNTKFGQPWQRVFRTDDRDAVTSYCARNGIEATWHDGDTLRTSAARKAIHQHPATGEAVWFNHVSVLHLSSFEPEIRTGLRQILAEEELPANTYFGDGEVITDEIVAHIRDCYRAAAIRIDYRSGDILVIDNMLMAHGREPYTGPREVAIAKADPSTDYSEQE